MREEPVSAISREHGTEKRLYGRHDWGEERNGEE
jgi:hypothetical protein